ncbi:MAG: sulfotransferase family protein [Planctomycetota bacterium]|nr:MAG: sulfotransferase family protein [Planctomycetota bacterium]
MWGSGKSVESQPETRQRIHECLARADWKSARNACLAHFESEPRSADVLNLLALSQSQLGQINAAVETLREAVAAEPDVGILRRNLGDVLMSGGYVDEALGIFVQLAEMDPADAELHYRIGVAAKHKNRMPQSIASLESALRHDPQHAPAHRFLADLYFWQGDLTRALDHYGHAVRLAPQDFDTREQYAEVLNLAGRTAEATKQFEAIFRADGGQSAEATQPRTAEGSPAVDGVDATADNGAGSAMEGSAVEKAARQARLGQALQDAGNLEQAAFEYEQALAANPDDVLLRCRLGALLIDLGRFEEAASHFEETLRREPNFAESYKQLADLAAQKHYDFSSQQVEAMKALLERGDLAAEDEGAVNFALASLAERGGDYDEAFARYQNANNAMQRGLEDCGRAFDPSEYEQFIKDSIEVFDAELFTRCADWGFDTEVPVFVVGMPRSGTTLVEQILAAHPQGAGAGELRNVALAAHEIPQTLGTETGFPKCMERATPEAIRVVAGQYLQQLVELGEGAARIVDKAPGNFIFLGLIAIAFPHAHIVHCRRDPLDTCLSCYQRSFGPVRWAWRLEDIASYYSGYRRITAHWQSVLPLPIHEVAYESMVEDPEATSRQLIEAVGLEWDDACLEFYKQKQAVKTVSRVQVKQPIYKTSVKRWKRYETHLAPLIERIDAIDAEVSAK